MKWNVALLCVSLTLLIWFAGGTYVEYLAAAEALSEDLAPRIDVDKDVLRQNLQAVLAKRATYRTIVVASPLALLTLLLAIRAVADSVRQSHART